MGAGRIAGASLIGVIVLIVLMPLSLMLGIIGDIVASIFAGCAAGFIMNNPEGGALASCFVAPICAGIVAFVVTLAGFATIGPLFGLYAGAASFFDLLIAFVPIWLCSMLGGLAGGIMSAEKDGEGLRIGPRLRERAGPRFDEPDEGPRVPADTESRIREPPVDFVICPNCNTKAPSDAIFCPECGAHISE